MSEIINGCSKSGAAAGAFCFTIGLPTTFPVFDNCNYRYLKPALWKTKLEIPLKNETEHALKIKLASLINTCLIKCSKTVPEKNYIFPVRIEINKIP